MKKNGFHLACPTDNKDSPCSRFACCRCTASLFVDAFRCQILSHLSFDQELGEDWLESGIRLIRCDLAGYCASSAWSLKGVRIGEALNPGPVPTNLKVTISNPTSLNQKAEQYSLLNSHIHCVSETSLTESSQTFMSKQYAKCGFGCVWGHPVPPQKIGKTGQPVRRGLSTGVAILSTLPIRPPAVPTPDQLSQTCRFVEAFVRVGHLTLQVISIYGVQPSAPQSKETTNAILAAALSRAEHYQGLTIFGGDFNHRPETLEIWEEFSRRGFVDVTTIAKSRWPEKVHGTCRGTTKNDTLLIPFCLVEQMLDFQVHVDDKFDIHAPMTVTFNIPVNGLFTRQWKQPASLESLNIDPTLFEEAYLEKIDLAKRKELIDLAKNDPDAAYTQWANLYEESASSALTREATNPLSNHHITGKPDKLTAKFRGRGVEPKMVAKPIPHYIRFPSNGGYQPSVDEHPVELRQVTRQVRRLQALHCRVR